MKKVYGDWKLEDNEINQGEYIFKELFRETGMAGGVLIWFEVAKRLISDAGCEIVEKTGEENDGIGTD